MASNESNFGNVLKAVNSQQRFPVMTLVRNSPQTAALISKLITPQEPVQYGSDGNREPVVPNVQMFKKQSEHLAQNTADAQTVMQIHPEMELSAQILISSILSPKDMMSGELSYIVTEGLLAPDISAALIARAKQYFEQVYKIQPQLPKILRDILFETGSYPVVVIPENAVDEVINGVQNVTMESLADSVNRDGSIRGIGLLGPSFDKPKEERKTAGLSLEHFGDGTQTAQQDFTKMTLKGIISKEGLNDLYVSVTDNFDALKMPEVAQRLREQRVLSKIRSTAMESMQFSKLNYNDRSLTGMLYREKGFAYKPIASLKTQDQLSRRSVGNPLILHLPSESVIPVYVPGNVEKHIGFFVLLDADGHPVTREDDTDYYQQLSSRLNSNGSFPSAMLTKVKSMMSGFDPVDRDHLDFTARAYGQMVEQDLLQRLRNGVYGDDVAIGKQEEVYRIMMARALAKQYTQLLFVPAELMTYFAFKFTSTGIGKSLLDDMKILNSLRAMLMFANVMSSLKNSIGRTEVKLKLDENDPNPQKTIEIAMHEIIRSRQQYFPLGINSPTDLVDWLQRSGFEFTFEGHPGIPDVAIDFGEKNNNYVKPDTDLEDSLRKRAIMSTGLSPETVDASYQAEFATSIVTNNLLFAKRVMQLQENFTPQLSDHMRKAMMNSADVMSDMRSIIANNFDKLKDSLDEETKRLLGDQAPETAGARNNAKELAISGLLNQFIMNFEVALPKPNSVTLEAQMTALETYEKALDSALDAIVSDKFFTSDMGGDVANQVSTIKEVLKAYFIRQWMNENGVLSELNVLTTQGEDGKPAVDIWQVQENHLTSLTQTLTKFMAKLVPMKEAANAVLNATGDDLSSGGSSSSSDDSGGGGGGDDDFGLGGGGDDFGLGGDDLAALSGGNETPPEGGEEKPAGGSTEPEEEQSLNAGLGDGS